MRRLWNKLPARQRAMLTVVGILAVLLMWNYGTMPIGDLPFPSTIREEERNLLKLKQRAAELEAERQREVQQLADLQEMATPFWQIEGKKPKTEIKAHFTRLNMAAQRSLGSTGFYLTTGPPALRALPESNYVSELTFSVTLKSATMRKVSKLLEQLDNAPHRFYWSRCTINAAGTRSVPTRPSSRAKTRVPAQVKKPADDKTVSLTGTIKALVLSPDATHFLAGEPSTNE
ncbi:MAG: hypothetical protein HN742_14260 [Lentisphaerae bacterium]|jgi:hypothetical protein|nr:hypothetical protein [Lentisphaerota bacterium]MBT5606632.1 hypothetical protein [Lentisphaerota bacterium]MBT7059525.1 hypothetical protein [Lentisphaerota bacterium]MBT7843038.1 hypothetical protein [Lentisphaerota bacterium]